MVSGIFCHDLPIYKDIEGNYCSTTLTDDLFRRYLHVVDKLIVATRVYDIDQTYTDAHQERITLPEVQILELPNVNTPGAIFSKIPHVKKLLFKTIQTVDLIFIRGGTIALLGIDVARKLKKPYLCECAGCAWDTYWNHSFLGKLIAPYMEFRSKRDVRNAAFVIYVTEKWLQKRYPSRGVTTHASNVLLQHTDEAALQKRLRKLSENLSKKQIIFGTTGGINNKAKGQQFMIQAIGILKDKYNIRYELVGSGNEDYLRSVSEKYGVSDNVIFKGQLNHEEIFHWLDDIDIYIQPSLQEGLPRALIEAMSRACPAIGSSTAGIPELLEKKAVFKRGNVSSLVNTIQNYLTTDLKKRARRNFEKSREYEISKLNARREKIYEQYRDYVLNGDFSL